MIMWGRGRACSRTDGTSGKAADGAGPGDGRVRRESREGRRGGGEDRGAVVSGTRCCLGERFAALVSRGDKNLLERRAVVVPSAARSRERKERNSLVEVGESPNGLVNWGGGASLGWKRPSPREYISEGFESALVGREDLRNLKKKLDLGEGEGEDTGEARSESRPMVKSEE